MDQNYSKVLCDDEEGRGEQRVVAEGGRMSQVADIRKFHLVSLVVEPTGVAAAHILATATDEDRFIEIAIAADAPNLIIVEVDSLGEIEIRPL